MAAYQRSLSISQLGVTEFVNCFSLLVVAGSISTSYFFGQLFHANLSFSFYWLLGSTIWIIYGLDHVLDGLKKKEESISVRHYIHYKYRKVIVPTLGAVAVFNAFIAYFFLDSKVMLFGLALGGLVILYFGIIHIFKGFKVNWLKELFVSIVVCAGMVVLPGLSGDMDISVGSLTLVACMILINFSNLLLFSYYDHDSDVANGLNSAATQWGKEVTRSVILKTLGSAFALFFFWTILILSPVKLPVTVALLLMFNILLMIYIQEDKFKVKGRYRFWGDFVFLIPGLVWWVLVNKQFF